MTKPPYHLHQSLGYQFSLTARILERRFEVELKALGLTRITWCVLLAVGVEGHKMPSDIACFIGIDRTAMSRALRQMETAGLIKRKAGKGDRRTTTVDLTTDAKALMERATDHARENAAHYGAKLTEDENQTLRRLLTKLRQGEETGLTQI